MCVYAIHWILKLDFELKRVDIHYNVLEVHLMLSHCINEHRNIEIISNVAITSI